MNGDMNGDMTRLARGRAAVWLVLAIFASTAGAEPLPADRIRQLTQQHTAAALELYRDFLGQPNDANRPEDILALIEWMEPQFAARGFATRRLPTAGSPVLFAHRPVQEARRTVLVYLQADGQPVDPAAWFQEAYALAWEVPTDAFGSQALKVYARRETQ